MDESFAEWVAGLPPASVYTVLVLLSALENVFPPVPADVAVVLGAFLSRSGVVSAPVLGVLCWIGNTGTSAAMYFLARARGRRFFESGWRRHLMPPEAMAAIERAYARHGVLGIFLSRFLPGIRAAVTPFAGVAGMTPVRALVPAVVASGIWYAMLVAIGAAVASNWEKAQALMDDLNRLLAITAVAIVALVAAWFWWRAFRRRTE